MFANPASAFKVDTHVWIAQEVIDDLKDDTRVKIKIGVVENSFDVDPAIRSAILAYPEQFMAGAIGPDAVPDIMLGQALIHPGAKKKHESSGASGSTEAFWGTDDWLEYMLESAHYSDEKAFVYGLFVHAASDIWAHSYVNMYSGDDFRFDEHADTLWEQNRRHFTLESFIGRMTPKLSTGKNPWDVVVLPVTHKPTTTQDCYREDVYGLKQRICDPVEVLDEGKPNYFLRTFLYVPDEIRSRVAREYASGTREADPKVIQQYQRTWAAADFGGAHFLAIYKLRYQLERILQGPELKKADHYADNLMYYSTAHLLPGAERDTVLSWANRARQMTYTSTAAVQNLNNTVNDFLDKSTARHYAVTRTSALMIDDHNRKLMAAHNRIWAIKNRIVDIQDDLDNLICRYVLGIPNSACDKISDLKSELRRIENELNAKLTEFVNEKNALADSLDRLYNVLGSVTSIQRSLDNLPFDIAAVLLRDSNPLRAILKNWASNIDSATSTYHYVGMDMMKNAMDPNKATLDPLKKWAFTDCNIVKLTGMGNPAALPACNIGQSVKILEQEISFALNYGGGALGSPAAELNAFLAEEVKEAVEQVAWKIAKAEAEKIAPELIAVLELIDKPDTDATMTAQFNNPTGKFLHIPDVVTRVRAEMRRTTSSTLCKGKSECFDKFRYPVIKHALTLSKLAIMTNANLDVVEQFLQIPRNALGDSNKEYLLFNTARSIDGNNQWYGERTPTYPRRVTPATGYSWQNDHFGVGGDVNLNGSLDYGEGAGRLFGDRETATTVFGKLFPELLNEGLFTPVGLANLPTVLDGTYRQVYAMCKNHPLQKEESDSYCDNVPDIFEGTTGGGGSDPDPIPDPDTCGYKYQSICP